MTRHPSSPRRSRLVRASALVAAWATVAVTLTAGTWTSATAVEGSTEPSATTVRWLDESQPERRWTSLSGAPEGDEITNPHYGDFENLRVTVAKTAELGDEPVSVLVEGMPGGSVGSDPMIPGFTDGTAPFIQQNFVQVMQCWGDPASPDFRETCTFGANQANQVAQTDLIEGTAEGRGSPPYRSPQGTEYYVWPPDDQPNVPLYREVINPASTNEVMAVPIAGDGSARFIFEVQSFRSAPYTGCGEELPGGDRRRCSLVVVPRGTVYGGSLPNGNPGRVTNYGEFGQQSGAPLDPINDYWDNRIVIPLDFAPPRSACGNGSSHVVSGSQLMIAAMQSWQAGVCDSRGQGVSFAPSGDEPSRQQALRGTGGLVLTSRAATGDDAATTGDIVYAPVAVGALSVAVHVRDATQEIRDMRLTPRLLAKLLTQHYGDAIPYDHRSPGAPRWGHRAEAPGIVASDPEYTSLNPQGPYTRMSDLVVAGPIRADGYRLLWEYLQADDEARAYLGGEPDANGHTANPFYLPSGHPAAVGPVMDETVGSRAEEVVLMERTRADGSPLRVDVGIRDAAGEPMCLCDAALDELPRFDQSLAPLTYGIGADRNVPRTTIDSIAHNPFASSFDHVAQRVFRGDPQRQAWNPDLSVPGQPVGTWTSSMSRQNLGGGISIGGLTDSASAAEYDLASVRLQLPNTDTFVAPDAEGMRSALAAQRPVGAEADTTWGDMAALPGDAYPLTLVVYAMVNLAATDAEERAAHADFIEYASTEGQVPGEGPGQLPEGYLPLTDDQRAQAAAAVARIRTYTPTEAERATAGVSTDEAPVQAPGTSEQAVAVDNPAPAGGPTVSSSSLDAEAAATVDVTSSPLATLVGGALVAGIVGAVGAPFLLRRRSIA